MGSFVPFLLYKLISSILFRYTEYGCDVITIGFFSFEHVNTERRSEKWFHRSFPKDRLDKQMNSEFSIPTLFLFPTFIVSVYVCVSVLLYLLKTY